MKQHILVTGSEIPTALGGLAPSAADDLRRAIAERRDTEAVAGLGSGAQGYDGGGAIIRVGLIDPYRFTRECLAKAFTLLHQDLVVYPFATVADCVSHADAPLDLLAYYSHDSGPPTAVVLGNLAKLREAFQNVPVVILSDATSASDPDIIRNVLRSGAQGFIPTQMTGIPAALAAIRFVQAGGMFAPLDLFLASRPEGAVTPLLSEPSPDRLTPRQKAVLSHLKQGKANKIIAYDLGVSESTVKVHVKNIMRKMGATNRTQAVYKAQQIWSSGIAELGADATPD